MLKFSGYSYLIRGQPLKIGGLAARATAPDKSEIKIYYAQRILQIRRFILGTTG
jgi:hypothetical protein